MFLLDCYLVSCMCYNVIQGKSVCVLYLFIEVVLDAQCFCVVSSRTKVEVPLLVQGISFPFPLSVRIRPVARLAFRCLGVSDESARTWPTRSFSAIACRWCTCSWWTGLWMACLIVFSLASVPRDEQQRTHCTSKTSSINRLKTWAFSYFEWYTSQNIALNKIAKQTNTEMWCRV